MPTTVFVVPSDLQRARDEGRDTTCRFWNFTADGEQLRCTEITQKCNVCTPILPSNAEGFGAWDGSNCRVLNETAEEVECGCDHLTHFAILLVSDGHLTGSTANGTLYATITVHACETIMFPYQSNTAFASAGWYSSYCQACLTVSLPPSLLIRISALSPHPLLQLELPSLVCHTLVQYCPLSASPSPSSPILESSECQAP